MAKKSNKNTKKQEFQTEEVFQDLDQFAHKTESFIEKNARPLGIAFGVLLVGAIAYFFYLQYVKKPKVLEANEELMQVQKYYAADSLDKVLNEADGAPYIINEKGGLPAAKLAAMFAGNAAYRQEKYDEALEYFKKYSSGDDITNSLAKTAMGDCYVQLDNLDDALKSYKKAIKETKNGGTQLIAVKKATIVAIESEKNKEALEILNTFKKEHPDVDNTGFVDAYIARLEAANGK